MKMNLKRAVRTLEDGIYCGTITDINIYGDEYEKAFVKIEMKDGVAFHHYTRTEFLEDYPWVTLFDEKHTEDTDDLIGTDVEFTIRNNASKITNKVFSNIVEIHSQS